MNVKYKHAPQSLHLAPLSFNNIIQLVFLSFIYHKSLNVFKDRNRELTVTNEISFPVMQLCIAFKMSKT